MVRTVDTHRMYNFEGPKNRTAANAVLYVGCCGVSAVGPIGPSYVLYTPFSREKDLSGRGLSIELGILENQGSHIGMDLYLGKHTLDMLPETWIPNLATFFFQAS